MLNKAQLRKDQEASKKPKKLRKPKDVIVDPRGQWAHPGEVTRIPSGDITMQGVPYPVLGVDNMGYTRMMMPGGDYTFPGTSVTEYPMAYGGTPHRGQIYDRLGRLHSIKDYVPFAQTGGQKPTPNYIPPPNYLMTNEDSTAYKTYFNRYLAGKAYDRANDLNKTPLRKDLLPLSLINKLLVEKNAYADAEKQMPSTKRSGGSLSPAKAREILHDGTTYGKPITDKQRRYFGYISNLKNGGMKKPANPFNYIQTEDEFFSRVYSNIPSPYNGGSFQFGGGARPFSTQPTMKQISSYGRPNWPYFFAQFGGNSDVKDQNVYNSTMEAMGNSMSGANYRFPTAPGAHFGPMQVPSPGPGGSYGIYSPPLVSHPEDPMTYLYTEDPELVPQKRMGGKKPCYNCGGSYKKNGGIADINQGPEYFTNKMNDFTGYLRDTATGAVTDDMSMNPMQYFMGGGLDRSKDYGSKKKPYASVAASDFAGPHRSYPIPTRADAVDALRLAGLHGAGNVKAKVYTRYPELRPKAKHGGNPAMAPYHNLSQEAYDAIYDQMYNMGGPTGYTEEFPYAMPYQYRDGGNWIAGAVNPAHKGYCTPMSKSTCTPRRKAFARRAKAHFKQDGGPMQEAKWQAIIALTEQGITDPIEIASVLNQEGTYPTTPAEVQGYLEQVQGGDEGYMQEGGPTMNPFAMSNIGMYGQANQEAQQDADTVGGMGNFLQATANLYRHGGFLPKAQEGNFQRYDQYPTNIRPQYQVAPGYGQFYGQPAGSGYGYFPANSMPYMKIKNKNYFYGMPQPQGQSQQPTPGANFPAGFTTPDGKGKISLNYGRGFLGLGPNRLRSMDYEWGNDMSGLPADSLAYINQNPLNRRGRRTTWVGNKLRGLTGNIDKYGTPFPSKSRKEDYEWEENYKTRKANQDSNAFVTGKTQAAGDAQFAKDQAMRSSDAWQENVQDKNLIPWLEDTAERLGTTPDALVNPPVPQTGPTPVSPEPSAPSKSMEELNEEYRQAIAERDRIFKEHNINKRGRHRNILGIKYEKGGPFIYGYMQGGGNPYSYLNPAIEDDPSMDPENLPGYVPPPTLSDTQIGEVFGEQQDSMYPGTMASKGRIKFGNRMAGEDAANWGIAGMNLATNIFSQDERRNAEKNLKKQFKAENIFSSRQDEDRGDYTTNYGYFRPDQQSVGRMVTGKHGGQYQEGGEYEMTDEEIQKLRRGGYTIEYI